MAHTAQVIKSAVKRSFSRIGIEVRLTGRHDWTDIGSFIPFEQTLKAASDAGLSVGDYIDGVMNKIPGATQATIDRMKELQVFAGRIDTVLEIGPGSGRYTEKTIAACAPTRYEIYETAAPWARYVRDKYQAILQQTTGSSLAPTASASVDLVQAHKVFSGLDLMVTLRYFPEIVRVTRSGGFVVFDVVTEACLDPATIDRWIGSGFHTGSYPAAIPRESVIGYFGSRGFLCAGTFVIPMGPGTTESFVFRKS